MIYPEYNTLILAIDKHVATVTLNRPEIHNALNDELINDLFDVFEKMNDDNDIRAIILTGAGKSFCAGADLNWLKGVVQFSYEQNYKESLKLAKLMYLIFTHSKPVIAKVNGAAIGGGVGLLSTCDIVIASDHAKFGLSEVRLGLVPAAISPFVISRIGEAKAREYFVTGERINADLARDIGLVNHAVLSDNLDQAVNDKVELILQNGPEALKKVKEMIFQVTQVKFPEIQDYTAKLIASLRISEEGQEGMAAFLEKRKPNWID